MVFNGSGIDFSSILNDQVTLGKVTINQNKYSFNKQSIHISKIVNQGYNNSNISGEALKKLDREVLIILYNLIIVIIISIISRLVIVCSLNKMKVRDWLRGNV